MVDNVNEPGSLAQVATVIAEHRALSSPDSLATIPPGYDAEFEGTGEILQVTYFPTDGTRNVGLERLSARRRADDPATFDLLLKVTNGGSADEDRAVVFTSGAVEVARADVSLSALVGIHNELIVGMIDQLGSEEQKQRWLPGLASGEKKKVKAGPKTGAKNQPMTFAMVDMVGSKGNEWQLLTAGAFVMMIVPLIVFLSLQRYFVRGLLAGSVKG